MENVFISNLMIENVRHLKNITIPLSQEEPKHLIFTGKNGSGKTSVLEAMSHYLDAVATLGRLNETDKLLKQFETGLDELTEQEEQKSKILDAKEFIERCKDKLDNIKCGITVQFSQPMDTLKHCFEKGQFILAYYKADRVFHADMPKHVEKVELKEKYAITDTPRQLFVKYLLDLKMTEALARNNGKIEKADSIKQWFIRLEELLRKVFADDSLELIFEEDTYSFFIREKSRELFDFNTMSSGYAAVLDIVLDIIVRMEKNTNRSFNFDMPGIVLIDEIETHLHLDLQKNILNFLTTVFPNIQFIVSTHSPFILSNLQNVVIYDLEENLIVENGLSNIPYGGIVEGYFHSSEMSALLQEKYERYKNLVKKQDLSDDDFEDIAELELFLNEIPDYLALNITTEYQRLKLEFESREDV